MKRRRWRAPPEAFVRADSRPRDVRGRGPDGGCAAHRPGPSSAVERRGIPDHVSSSMERGALLVCLPAAGHDAEPAALGAGAEVRCRAGARVDVTEGAAVRFLRGRDRSLGGRRPVGEALRPDPVGAAFYLDLRPRSVHLGDVDAGPRSRRETTGEPASAPPRQLRTDAVTWRVSISRTSTFSLDRYPGASAARITSAAATHVRSGRRRGTWAFTPSRSAGWEEGAAHLHPLRVAGTGQRFSGFTVKRCRCGSDRSRSLVMGNFASPPSTSQAATLTPMPRLSRRMI